MRVTPKLKSQIEIGLLIVGIGLPAIFFIPCIGGKLVTYWLAAYALFSLLTYHAYRFVRFNKVKLRLEAKEGGLHFLAFIGGFPGAILAQWLLPYRSKNRWFPLIFWGIVAAHILVFWVIWR